MRYKYVVLCVCLFGFALNGWGQEAVHDVIGVALDTHEEQYTEKTIVYTEETEKYNKEVLGVIGADSSLELVRLEWARDDENSDGKMTLKNLLNLKYFIPWVPKDLKEKLSETFNDENRGKNNQETGQMSQSEPVDPLLIQQAGDMLERLLLSSDTTQKVDQTKTSQAKQMLMSSLHADAVALTAIQVPVSVPEFPAMNNMQELYDGMAQLVLAQQSILNENIGLDAVKGQPMATGQLYNEEKFKRRSAYDKDDPQVK